MMRVALDASLSRHRGGVCILSMYGVKQLGEIAWRLHPLVRKTRTDAGESDPRNAEVGFSHYHSVFTAWLALRIGAAGRGFLGRDTASRRR